MNKRSETSTTGRSRKFSDEHLFTSFVFLVGPRSLHRPGAQTASVIGTAPTEAAILKCIIDYRLRKVFFWRQNVGGYKTTKGAPDICIVKDGFIGLEVKKPDGKQSPDQKAFEAALVAAGGRYYVVRSIGDVQALGI